MKRLLTLLCCCITTGLAAEEPKPSVYMVSNAHLDTQWNWDVKTTIDTYVRNTLYQNLWLLEQYPDYVFNFEGAVKYHWMKEYYPDAYQKIRKYVEEGRWHISGSSWDATDPNIPSTESFFRNILLGQEFYKREFGCKSTDIFLPDCFGFSYALPTIASHAGLIGFSTQKLQWRRKPFYGNSKIPFYFGYWQGVDGSRILAALDGQGYSHRFSGEDLSQDEGLLKLACNYPAKKGFRYYGTGDVGGSPTPLSVESVVKGVHGNGPLRVISAASDQLFRDYLAEEKPDSLPHFDGELLMDVHATGCYTSQAAMKLYNRRNEQLADAAERAAVIADWLGAAPYPGEALTEEWRRVIWHQFHDDLTGTSIPRAYTYSWNDELIAQTRFVDYLTTATAAVARSMETRTKGTPVIVFNPLAQSRRDLVVARVPMTTVPDGISVYGPDGRRVKAQLQGYKGGVAEILFTAEVDPVSYSVFEVRNGGQSSSALKASQRSLENRIYRIRLDEQGNIASIVDKRYGRELVKSGAAIRLALFTENKSYEWPAWEILKETVDARPETVAGNVKITIEEVGPVRASLRVERSYGDSHFVQIISLTDGAQDDRIDIRNEIDWRETHSLLKAEFPLAAGNAEATYDLGIGSVRRGNNTETAYEVYAQQWADLTAADRSYGVTIMNDSKYGWDKPDDNTLRLTLLHTPRTQRNYAYQDHQDWGYHTFTYSIVGHKGDCLQADVVRKADAMNNPLYAFRTEKHAGELGRRLSMVRTNDSGIDVKALKKAESGDFYVVRVYETQGENHPNAQILFNSDIVWARELNGIEEEIGEASFDGHALRFSARPFAPKTFAVRLAEGPKAEQPRSEVVALPCNEQGYTNDAFYGFADIDGRGNSYAAELLPEKLVSANTEFRFGEFGRPNILRCEGDTLRWEAGKGYRTLYLLAAATDRDRTVEFRTPSGSIRLSVPYYSGFFGQWGGIEQQFQGFVRDAEIAWVGTHRHSRNGNEPYTFTYMYRLAIPLQADDDCVVLPRERNLVIFAASLSEAEAEQTTPAAEFRRLAIK